MPGDRVEGGHGLVQHEQPRPARQSQRQLRLLATGELARLALERDRQVAESGFGVSLIEGPVQVSSQVEHVGDGQVLVALPA
jgi:hypothetical protein